MDATNSHEKSAKMQVNGKTYPCNPLSIFLNKMDWKGKNILAPMVRVGTLPFRLLALEYGADIVYSPETIDKKLIGCRRIVNSKTIDYVRDDGTVVFQTHPMEKTRLVFQLGTACPELALKAALTVVQDVSAFDLNCGCPKKFSIQGGMGAALLSQPITLLAILENLVKGSGKPVSCKIRLLHDHSTGTVDMKKTIELIRAIQMTGVKAIAIHTRTRDERPRDPAHWECFKQILDVATVPIIANGDLLLPNDREKLKEIEPRLTSFMFARGAEANPSIIAPLFISDKSIVARQYLSYCLKLANIFPNTKYTLQSMFKSDGGTGGMYKKIVACKSMKELCALFELEMNDDVHDTDMAKYDSDLE